VSTFPAMSEEEAPPKPLLSQKSMARAEAFVYKPGGKPKGVSRKAAKKLTPRQASPRQASPRRSEAQKADTPRKSKKSRKPIVRMAQDEGAPAASATDVSDPDVSGSEALRAEVARLQQAKLRLEEENAQLRGQPATAAPAADAAAPVGAAIAAGANSTTPALSRHHKSNVMELHSEDALVSTMAATSAAAAAEVDRLRTENESLVSKVQVLTTEVEGLRTECAALRSISMAGMGGGGGAAAGGGLEAAAAQATLEVSQLRAENEKLSQRLNEAIGKAAALRLNAVVRSLSSGKLLSTGGSSSSLCSGVTGSAVASAPAAADPAKEKELFLAVGFNTDSRSYERADARLLRELLSSGVRMNARDNSGTPPLAHAAWGGDDEVLSILIQHGADLDAENLDGATPLHYAVFNKQPKAAALLIAAGADASVAEGDAGAVGTPELKAIFQAASGGGTSHPMLAAAAARVEQLRRTK
jgi:cell division protein FtsB